MSLKRLDSLADWLDLTDRELEILKLLYKLEMDGVRTSPENIVCEFARVYKTSMQKPNLFHLLKKLRQQGYVKREGYGNYVFDLDGVNQALDDTEKQFTENHGKFQKFREDLESSFKRMAWDLTAPGVDYLDYDDFFTEMGRMTKEADTLCIVANFPEIGYTSQLIDGLDQGKYVKPLYTRAVTKKKLTVNYLTDLNMDFLFNQAFRVMDEPQKAYRQCAAIIDKIEMLCGKHDTVNIRYLDDPHGLDVAVKIRDDEPIESILFIRDEHQNITGGINIKSKDTATNAHQMFQRGYEYATPLNSSDGKKILDKARTELTQKYGVLED